MKYLLLTLIALTGCHASIPKISVKFWAGDSKNAGITRAQDHETISCASPDMDSYMCITFVDMQKIFDTMLTCKQWGAPVMTKKDMKEFRRENNFNFVRYHQ